MVRVGLIGYNEGNGHPYSFSAIINGYDRKAMEQCPYPVIYNYLESRPSTEIGLTGMEIQYVWCPEKKIAEDIARCTYIQNVVECYEDMLDYVDAIIIARDDVDSHFEIGRYFLEGNKYVFVDKPLCRDKKELEFFRPFLEKGQLMSCSGLRFKNEMRTSFYGQLKKEDVLFVNAVSVLDWYKYAIHVLEAVTPIMGIGIEKIIPIHGENYFLAKIEYSDNRYMTIQINSENSFGIKAIFFCKGGKEYSVTFDDNFECFKYMLQEFYRMIETGKPVINPHETIVILNAIIEGGQNAYK